MGQLERYGLYVLVVVIFLILGVAIMGGDAGDSGSGSPRSQVTAGGLTIPGGGGAVATPDPNKFTDVRTHDRLQRFLVEDLDATPPPRPANDERLGPSAPVPVLVGDDDQPTTTVPAPAPGPAQSATYVVRAGDSFAKIARAVYGDERKYLLIASANPSADPARLQPGQELVIPSAEQAAAGLADADRAGPVAAVDADGTKIHVVQRGEIMGTIAKLHYGSATQWRRIAAANQDVDPNSMKPGTKLRIPLAK